MELAKAACAVETAPKKMRLNNSFKKVEQPINNNFKCLHFMAQVFGRHVETCSCRDVVVALIAN